MIRQAWPFLAGRAPGDRGLAAVVAHVRRQPQREHDAHQRRHALRRRRAPGARRCSPRRSRTSPTCRRPSTSTCPPGTPSWCRRWRATRSSPARFFSRLRLMFNAAAALPAGAARAARRPRRADAPGRTIPVTGSWGATETAPAVTRANFRVHRRPVHRRAAAGRAGQAGPGRGRLRDPGQGPERHPRLLRPARPDRGRRSTPRASTGRATRSAFADPGDPNAGPGLPRPDRRGLQAEPPARSSGSARSAPRCCPRCPRCPTR